MLLPEPLAGACCGVPHPLPIPRPGSAFLSFLTPRPRIPGMPRGGDYAAPPALPFGLLPEATLGGGEGEGRAAQW